MPIEHSALLKIRNAPENEKTNTKLLHHISEVQVHLGGKQRECVSLQEELLNVVQSREHL